MQRNAQYHSQCTRKVYGHTEALCEHLCFSEQWQLPFALPDQERTHWGCAAHHTEDYRPWGGTPLNDAVGSTLTDLKATVRQAENAIGSVTILTDGEENSSKRYTTEKVARMIEELKEIGWNFNFIGANIDVVKTAQRYCIDNTLEFQQDDAGTEEMFVRERNSRMRYYDRMNEVQECCMAAPSMCDEDRQEMLRKASGHYFDEELKNEDVRDDSLNVNRKV